jgi:ferritin-like metal-binding protein YciE
MTAQNKAKKKNGQLEADIKTALSAFAKGIESKKLGKKINKHSADVADLISKLKKKAKKKKAKTPKAKKASTKPVKKEKEGDK